MQPPTMQELQQQENAFELHFGEVMNSMINEHHGHNDESFNLTFDFLLPQSDSLPTEPLTFISPPIDKKDEPCTASIASPSADQQRSTAASTSMVPLSEGQKYVDITDFLCLPQTQAAKMIGVPTSTLSKRWKEAAQGKKWPYRTLRKLDKGTHQFDSSR